MAHTNKVRIKLKCRHVQHHCAVIIFCASEIMDCICLHLKNNSAHAHGASVVWNILLPLVNTFNKTEAATFLMQVVLPEGFLFYQFNTQSFVFCPLQVSFTEPRFSICQGHHTQVTRTSGMTKKIRKCLSCFCRCGQTLSKLGEFIIILIILHVTEKVKLFFSFTVTK